MPETDLDLLLSAAKEAGAIAMKHFGQDLTIEDKADNQGPVTNADLEVDTALREILLSARPDYGWLSEESETETDRRQARRCFVIDPIDGTRAFIDGGKSFAHSLAIVEDGQPIFAVVLMPAAGRIYSAELGGGARLNNQIISASAANLASGATVVCNKASLAPDLWPGGLPQLDRHFRPSLAYRLCTVAQGKFDAALTLHPTWEWDIAAGDLICREAGARVTTPQGHAPQYNTETARLTGIIAAGIPLHSELMSGLDDPASA